MLTERYFLVEAEETTAERLARIGNSVSRLIRAAQAGEVDSIKSAQMAVDDNTLSVRTPWLNHTKW